MIEDLFSDDLDHLKRWQGRYGINQHVSMDTDEMLRV